MEGFSPLYWLVAIFATGLGVYAIFRGRRDEDQKALGIGVALPILAWLITSPGPLGFCTLVLGVGLFSDEIQGAWTAGGKNARVAPVRPTRRPPALRKPR